MRIFAPTLKRVHADLLAECEGLVDILLLDALDAEVGEGGGHVVVHVDGADPLLAALLAHQVVGMWPVGLLLGHAGHHHHRLARVTQHLNKYDVNYFCHDVKYFVQSKYFSNLTIL